MVSTRKHPSEFAAPDESPPAAAKIASPTKRSTRSSSKASTPAPAYSSADESTAVVKKRMSPPPRPSPASRARARSVSLTWSHTPSTTIMVWLAVSLPLVVWDTGYVLGRPHTMPGGALHAPIWSPYALYGTVDYVYGFPAVEARDGFTAAQGWLNAIETALYLVYVWFAFYYGHAEEGATGARAGLLTRRKIVGREAGIALLIAYSAAIMTVSKTVLYGWLSRVIGKESYCTDRTRKA